MASEQLRAVRDQVTGVAFDSRTVRPGDLYVALPGAATHGARFADRAVASGAVAILTDAEGAALAAAVGVPVIVSEHLRDDMAEIAASVQGHPAAKLGMFGITGTNGKTSTTFLLEAALAALGRRPATIGTIGFRVAGEFLDVGRTTVTTPESPDLQALLARFVAEGATDCVMEVSSHALALRRVDGMTFDVAAFTMLGQDHLDFHHTLTEYFDAKARLFRPALSRGAVINTDDEYGRLLAALVTSWGGTVVSTAVDSAADYRVLGVTASDDGRRRVRLGTPDGEVAFGLSMLGDFNVRNAAMALAMVGARGLDVAAAAEGLASAQVPGRMQRVELPEDAPAVVVDFAHTPQAVDQALSALPATGRRIAVLGAGGDRDPSKRGPMGAAAARHADLVIVTDDNPRSEVPEAIRNAVLAGAREAAESGTEVVDGGERAAAIGHALAQSGPGDWVAVLGKGHERGQNIGGVIRDFDDVDVVQRVWRERS